MAAGCEKEGYEDEDLKLEELLEVLSREAADSKKESRPREESIVKWEEGEECSVVGVDRREVPMVRSEDGSNQTGWAEQLARRGEEDSKTGGVRARLSGLQSHRPLNYHTAIDLQSSRGSKREKTAWKNEENGLEKASGEDAVGYHFVLHDSVTPSSAVATRGGNIYHPRESMNESIANVKDFSSVTRRPRNWRSVPDHFARLLVLARSKREEQY
ncbi:hypothetical protein C8R45DRAFT_935613 [Mycena sanguinolenta]|nr:hypothetical protein C8R45DRAFT_935613 [Mycena sanguinolenta]